MKHKLNKNSYFIIKDTTNGSYFNDQTNIQNQYIIKYWEFNLFKSKYRSQFIMIVYGLYTCFDFKYLIKI